MTTDNKPYWEQDIAECLRVAAEIIGPNSYYLRAAEYIEEMRERLSSLQSECEERRKDAVNLTEKVIPNLRDRISKLEGSVNTLESECNQLNDQQDNSARYRHDPLNHFIHVSTIAAANSAALVTTMTK